MLDGPELGLSAFQIASRGVPIPLMATDLFSPYASLRREVSERLHSFFIAASDGRATSLDAGAAVASSQGPHRESNEDRAAIVRFRFGSARTDLRLAILCDGMGGMSKGAEAAALAASSFIAAFGTIETDCPLAERLERSCIFANRAVFHSYHGEAGTTLTAIAFANHARCAVHVGDSRLYGVNEDRQIELLTKDDTVSGAVNAHLGQSDEDEMDNRLLQFVGIGDAMAPSIINVEEDQEHYLWLLTSDGAHSVGRRTLTGICGGSKGPYDMVRKLVYVSEAMNTQDNATAICIKSGFVAASADEHEGLTIQITAPDRNLEIWFPTAVMQIAASPLSEKAALSKSEEEVELPERAENMPVPASPKKRTQRRVLKRNIKPPQKKKRTLKRAIVPPIEEMNFIFEPGSNDDD